MYNITDDPVPFDIDTSAQLSDKRYLATNINYGDSKYLTLNGLQYYTDKLQEKFDELSKRIDKLAENLSDKDKKKFKIVLGE